MGWKSHWGEKKWTFDEKWAFQFFPQLNYVIQESVVKTSLHAV
jgi:hypothetical protein